MSEEPSSFETAGLRRCASDARPSMTRPPGTGCSATGVGLPPPPVCVGPHAALARTTVVMTARAVRHCLMRPPCFRPPSRGAVYRERPQAALIHGYVQRDG